MAGTEVITDIDAKSEKQRLAEEKKRLKAEKKEQKKEAKRRAKEIAMQEEELGEDEIGGGVPVFLVTALIVVVWIAILCLLIKLDVGGFGSGVLTPVLKDVPVISKILPTANNEEMVVEEAQDDSYGG